MAKNTQEAEVIVTMNGQAAKKAVAELAQEYEKLQKEALEAYKAGDDALGKKLDAQAQKLMKDIEITRRETKKFADVMKNINGASLKELRSAAKQLQSEINKLAPGTQAFIEKSKQLQQVNTRIRQLTNEFKGLVVEEKQATFSLKGLADGFNKYFGMVTAGIAAVTGISMAFRKSAEDAAKLDDVYSDVMKTTGLLHEQVEELDKELMKMDTRTSREQLLLLARDAGKLGIQGKENILGFVRAADQIQVALGEDLGEGAIKNLGKIADVLGLTQSMGIEKALLSIGSAVNAVGQASTASEAYLVDFTQRLAGVAAQTNISASNIIGFASGLDQSAMKVEMAATAFQKFLMKLYEDPAKFAAYANLEVGKFTELLKTDANQAVITILKALKDQDGFASLVPIFKDMGLDGARAVSVLAAMATNINAVTEAQAVANDEFAKATSVTEEYNTKNNNMQAQLEKARKEFHNASVTLGQSLNPIMLKSTKATTYLIKALANYGKEIKSVLITLAVLTAAIKAKTIATAAYNAVVKAGTVLQKTWQAIVWATRTAFFKLIGATEAATIAQSQLNAVMSASVFGVIAMAIAGVVAAIVHYTKEANKSNEVTEKMNEIQKRINSEYGEGAGKVQALTNIVHNNNLELDQRRRALDELKKIVPGYHADLTKEGQLINDNTDALKEYLKNLEKVTRQKILQEEYEKAVSEVMEAEKTLEDATKSKDEALANAGGNTATIRTFTMQSSAGAYSTSEVTPYGKALKEETAAQEDLNQKKEIQLAIERRINNELGMKAGRLTEEEKAVKEINDKYKVLFNEIRDQYRDNPAVGEDRIAELEATQAKEIQLVRKKFKEIQKIEDENGGNGGGGLTDKEAKKNFDARIKQIEENQRKEEIALKRGLMNNEITQAEYNARMNLLVMQGLQQRIEAAKRYGQDETKYVSQLLDEEIKLVGNSMEEVGEMVQNANIQSDITDPQAYEAFWEQIYRKRDDIVASLQERSLSSEYETEMMWLEKLHDRKLLSEELFEKAKAKTKLKYLEQYTEKANTIADKASGFVNALREAENAQLEAQYQKDLAAAGDNAEKKASVEAEYEQKKLDLQKKYADVEMVVNIAKTIASGAVAAIRAYAEGGPYAGPILAALIAATTAAEVATIVAQRDAIKNTSVNTTASTDFSTDSTSAPTGKRTITGMAKGGFTADHTTLTTIGEEGIEWVAPHWMVQENPVTFANLERYRKTGSNGHSGSRQQGFAYGGYSDEPAVVANSAAMLAEIDWQAMREFNTILRYCAENGLFVKYGDILIANEKHNYFKNITAR